MLIKISNVLHDFDSSNSRMKNYIYLPDNPTEADYFKLFFDSDLVEHILEKKKHYYTFVCNKFEVSDHSKLKIGFQLLSQKWIHFLV